MILKERFKKCANGVLVFHGCKYFWVAGCDRKEHAISPHYYLTKWTPPNKGISDLSSRCAPMGEKKSWLIDYLYVGQMCSVCEVVWPVCVLAGDEDVEEGEGQNENSGESDEAPPKVKHKLQMLCISYNFCLLFKLFVYIGRWRLFPRRRQKEKEGKEAEGQRRR